MKSLIIYLFEAERKGENTADSLRKIYLTNYQRIKTIKYKREIRLWDIFLHKTQEENNPLFHIKRLLHKKILEMLLKGSFSYFKFLRRKQQLKHIHNLKIYILLIEKLTLHLFA